MLYIKFKNDKLIFKEFLKRRLYATGNEIEI